MTALPSDLSPLVLRGNAISQMRELPEAPEGQAALDGPTPKAAPDPPMNEAALFRKLALRFPRGSYALLRHVANGTGAREYRWADAVAMGTWPSRGLDINGIEIKVSRSDWLAELKEPAKAEQIGIYCDYWWLVVPGRKGDIVKPGELPLTWGMMRWHGGRFVTDRAPAKQTPRPITRDFLAAVLRRAQEQLPAEAALASEFKRGKEEQAVEDIARADEQRKSIAEDRNRMWDSIRAFESASGLKLDRYDVEAVRALGRLVQAAQHRGAPYFEERLRTLARTAREIADEADKRVKIVEGSAITCECVKRRGRDADINCKICGGTGLVPASQAEAPV